MRDPFANYDAWLEAPYQDAIEAADHYYTWCETHDLDPDNEDSVFAYNLWCEDNYDYEQDDAFDYDF